MKLIRGVLVGLATVLVVGVLQATSAAAAPGITYVRTGPWTSGQNWYGVGWAACPAGSKATGGAIHADHMRVRASYAYNDGTGWLATASVQPDIPFYVTAMCVSGLTDYSVHTAYTWVPPERQDGMFAFCPRGTSMVGGGAMDDSDRLSLTRNVPLVTTSGGVAWLAQYWNDDTVAHKATSQVICANGIDTAVERSAEVELLWTGYGGVHVDCPTGYRPISGGGYAPQFSSHGIVDARSWGVRGYVGGPPTSKLQAQVVCGR